MARAVCTLVFAILAEKDFLLGCKLAVNLTDLCVHFLHGVQKVPRACRENPLTKSKQSGVKVKWYQIYLGQHTPNECLFSRPCCQLAVYGIETSKFQF